MDRIVFDFPAGPDRTAPSRRAVFRHPREIVAAWTLDDVRPALRRVQEAADAGLHAAGFLSYEAAPAFEPAMRVRGGGRLPLLWFGLFTGPEDAPPGDGSPADPPDSAAIPALDWRMDWSRAEHARAIAEVRDAIVAARTYQVNLTTRLRTDDAVDPWTLYVHMRRAQGPGYHAFLDLGRFVVVSASPELFFRTHDRAIATRPMKGTRPRGRWPEEDRSRADELRESGKDRAENLMIVDLLRNDLGRVCETGSVRVPVLYDIERFRTVWQMTSSVEGRLRDDVGLVDVFTALFPCGSVTGAPKISTMAEIARIETSPREVYCGAIGWVRPGGDATFSVPIRTAWLDRETGGIEYGAGGGVVWDSTADGEYDELRAKAVVVREPWPDLSLLETLALRDGRFPRRDRHLRRMRESANYFGFPFPADAISDVLDGLARRHTHGAHLARITLDDDGAIATRFDPLDLDGHAEPTAPADDDARPIVLADQPVDSANRFLFHKTTHREVYDAALAAAPTDAFDVLLHNERGEVTELTRGNLVAELDGRWLTPARDSGLLAGCLRQELLEAGVIEEAVIRRDDLERATGLWFINSARGWIPVRIAER